MSLVVDMDILKQIIQPISADSAVGVLLVDDSQLHFIDDELMKVGSLSHASIAWEKVAESALDLLSNKTKDIKVLTSYLQCLQQDADVEELLFSLQVMEAFLKHYWSDAHPKPGDKGKSVRNRFYKQIIQRSVQAIKRAEIGERTNSKVTSVLASLEKVILELELDLELFAGLKAAFSSQQRSKVVAIDEEKETSEEANPAGAEQAPTVPKVYFDAKNERATRQSLYTMAYFLNASDPSNAIGYRVRRNALWFSIWQLPSVKNENVTELAAYSVDRFSDYCGLIEKSANLELLNKLERSIEQSPYWFDGHYLSFQLSNKLNLPKVASAIRQELQEFVSRFPEILNFKANDASDFASKETKQWLSQSTGADNSANSEQSAEHNWQKQFSQVQELCAQSGLNSALNFVNTQLQQATNTRDHYYWRLINADLLNQQQLTTLAKNEYQVLLNNVQGMSMDDWEPSFAGHIKQSLENMDNLGL